MVWEHLGGPRLRRQEADVVAAIRKASISLKVESFPPQVWKLRFLGLFPQRNCYMIDAITLLDLALLAINPCKQAELCMNSP